MIRYGQILTNVHGNALICKRLPILIKISLKTKKDYATKAMR